MLLIMPQGFALQSTLQADIDKAIATVENEVWEKYCTGIFGRDWTVENGKFKPITNPLELEKRKWEPIRSNERVSLYSIGDNLDSKLNRLHRTGQIGSEEYNAKSTLIYQWMQAVNDTQKQEGYPITVVYPKEPSV